MAPRTPKGALGMFEGRPIMEAGVIVRKTGDGLSESVKVDPDIIGDVRIGDEGYIVFSYKCIDVHHPALNRKEPTEGGLKRVPVLDAGTATFIDDDVVAEAIRRQQVKNEAWRESQAGVTRLPGTDHEKDHLAGEHVDGRVPGCPECDRERDLEEAGQ